MIGIGTADDPMRPDIVGSFVCVAQRGNKMLVKRPVADGTTATATTIADQINDTDGSLKIAVASLTGPQRTAIRTVLRNAGIDVADFDLSAPTDRSTLLGVLLRAFGFNGDLDFSMRGYQVDG